MRWHRLKGLRPWPRLLVLMAMVAVSALTACAWQGSVAPSRAGQARIPGGDADRGWQIIQEYGCISCHTIPGVPRANATVGPPLDLWAERHYIAGQVTNTPENLIFFLRYPEQVSPGTAMPNMGVTEQDACDMGAYLYTLQRSRWDALWQGQGRGGRWGTTQN
jgi:cytochrome c